MEQEKKTVEKSGIGTVKIADEVVTLIVAYAALDVDGVAYIAGNVDRAILSKGGVRKLGKNVKVEVSKNGVKAELAIIRLAIYEIFYDEDIDKAIAINEAVELAKKVCFG